MNYTQVLKTFYIEWEALIKLLRETNPDLPQLSKNITPIEWIEYFKYFLFRAYGICDFHLRDTVEIPDETSDPLQVGFSYG